MHLTIELMNAFIHEGIGETIFCRGNPNGSHGKDLMIKFLDAVAIGLVIAFTKKLTN